MTSVTERETTLQVRILRLPEVLLDHPLPSRTSITRCEPRSGLVPRPA